jgi:hypothetical protein
MDCKALNFQDWMILRWVCMYIYSSHLTENTLFPLQDQPIYAVCGYTVSVQYDSCAIYPDWLWSPPATYQLIPAVRIRCVKLITHCRFSAGVKKIWSYSSTPLVTFHHTQPVQGQKLFFQARSNYLRSQIAKPPQSLRTSHILRQIAAFRNWTSAAIYRKISILHCLHTNGTLRVIWQHSVH